MVACSAFLVKIVISRSVTRKSKFRIGYACVGYLSETTSTNRDVSLRLLLLHSLTFPDVLFDLFCICVLMDCQMPEMDGYETTHHIRSQEKFSRLPIIAITANAMKGDKGKVLAVGMNDHIAKPFVPDVMYKTIVKWLK